MKDGRRDLIRDGTGHDRCDPTPLLASSLALGMLVDPLAEPFRDAAVTGAARLSRS